MVNNREHVLAKAYVKGINLRTILEGAVGVSLGETTAREDIVALFDVLLVEDHDLTVEGLDAEVTTQDVKSIPEGLVRIRDFLTHELFYKYHSEAEMLRYIKSFEKKTRRLSTQ